MSEPTKISMTTVSTVVDVVEGDPPSLVTVKRAVNPQGIARHVTQRMRFSDHCLFERFAAEVRKGDQVRLTLITDWSEANFGTTVAGFERLEADASALPPAKELAAQVA